MSSTGRPTVPRQRAFLAGFLASREGYNGEHPFGDNDMSIEDIWAQVKPQYTAWIIGELGFERNRQDDDGWVNEEV